MLSGAPRRVRGLGDELVYTILVGSRAMPTLNDIHSRLNATEVASIVRPANELEVVALVEGARREGGVLCPMGGRHAMGGQQFCAGSITVDTTGLADGRRLDQTRGLLTIGAGACWPEVIAATRVLDATSKVHWAIRQKQTGADAMTLGGSVACNAHGRGLAMGPLADDVESLRMVMPDARVVQCSRATNADLFALVIGGYGLFGIVTEVTLRLSRRQKLRRLVDIIDLDDAVSAVYRRAEQGCLYGDFQYAIDPSDDAFLRRGVFACYQPAADDEPVDTGETDLPRESWLGLLELAHSDKRRAFQVYSEHYLATHGRVYWSDTMQLSTYIPTYAEFLAARRPGVADGAGPSAGRVDESLVITELFVPPASLMEFMRRARMVLRATGVEDIYGTIRAVRRDETTFLPWAKDDFACVIFNLRTPHTPAGLARSQDGARGMIDAALDLGGSFYLTYHRWATREQVLRAYPQFPAFLSAKAERDPRGVFQSDWYRHSRSIVGAG